MRKNAILSLSLSLVGIVHSIPLSPTSPTSPDSNCFGSSDEQVINMALYKGGEGFTVELCPGAVIEIIGGPVFFAAAGQSIVTQGLPHDSTRASFLLTGAQSTAIVGNWPNIALKNVIVDGLRPELGVLATGTALVELTGQNQTIAGCWIHNTRSWSCLHLAEGPNKDCSGTKILNNSIGPCGTAAPISGSQFPESIQTWADGISLACSHSLVSGNTIIDATDGGIVLFHAPGSIIENNTIVAHKSTLMGGINLVDFAPYGGVFLDTIVRNNVIRTEGSMIKVGIAIGTMVWGSDNRTASRTAGSFVSANVLSSVDGAFGYGISVAGHSAAQVADNDASQAKFGGIAGDKCLISPSIPTPQAFIFDPTSTSALSLQSDFKPASIAFLICIAPSPIVATVESVQAVESAPSGQIFDVSRRRSINLENSAVSKTSSASYSKFTPSIEFLKSPFDRLLKARFI